MHPLGGFGEQRHVRIGTGPGNIVLTAITPLNTCLVTAMSSRSEVRLNTDDGVHTRGCSVLPKLIGTKHHAVVSHGNCRHFLTRHFIDQIRDPGGTIQHGVLRVHVKVRKRVARRAHRYLLSRAGFLE